MNPLISNWLYLLLVISFVYWFIVGGLYLFPNVSPWIISIIAAVLVYFLSNQQSLVLLI